jgi:acyl transferase domain-containing protein/NADPH:quinone reductase-like Zn-dependent oxidoreductase
MAGTMPSAKAQAALIRHTYKLAGIADVTKTALFECHATGTYIGDPIEADAIVQVWGDAGLYLGTVKPNLGHSEGASALSAILKATLALEHAIIPPNIKYAPLNPRIPFESANLHIPSEPTPWPQDRDARVSVNSFGIGGSNAHAIVESPARFLPAVAKLPSPSPWPPASNEPQLLLFSANTSPALKNICHNYQALLDDDDETQTSSKLPDIAYTLANGRVHLPLRSFAVATTAKFDQGVSLATSGKKGATSPHNAVMVFTGQGAAWPQMGRALLLANTDTSSTAISTFAHTIEVLDSHLQRLGAAWSLKEELLKPTRTSRVYEAEFSQPLCTALQLALVDSLASVGVKPHAVVGHSSGEIAAAYASGALTAEEAIAVAFHRGAATKGQTERGGMAAIGLGWDAVQQYIVPGVVTACDNSPNSVTLSGDKDALAQVVTSIKQALPDVLATTLKVDKAYHSHHMLALGEAYHQAMVDSQVEGKLPTIPFFSSVTGDLLATTKGSQLGPKYWQSNLERPVLFKAAVQAILKSTAIKNPVMLEIGPHSALSGPLRQILTAASSTAPYLPSLMRRQSSVENLLQAIGKLYTLHVALDFKALAPAGSSLVPGLPCYPWDHSQRFFYESRISKEWLNREYVHHTLLGSRVHACTDLEPVWRNLLDVNTSPWLAHHKLGDDIVFPLAAFVSIAAEAGRQVTGIDDGVSIRNITVHNALVLNGESAREIVTTLHRERLTDSSTSEWWEFSVSSHNGHVWTKHATGDVRGETFDKMPAHGELSEELPRKVDSAKWYEATRRAGLDYGPSFNTLEDIRTSTTTTWPHKGTAMMRNNQWGDESYFHLHPVILDTYYQLVSSAVHQGIGRDYRRMVAAKIDLVTMFRSSESELRIFTAPEPTDKGYIADGWVSAGSNTILRISGSHGHIFEEAEAQEEEGAACITARSEWVPHVDFQNNSELIKQPRSHQDSIPLLDELAQLAIALAVGATATIDVQAPHLKKYKEWLLRHTPSGLKGSDAATLTQTMNSLVERLQDTSAGRVASAISAVSGSIEALMKGEETGWEAMNNGEGLTTFLRDYDDSDYIRSVAHTKANVSVLELGAELGEKTRKNINSLTRADGQPLYSQYVVANATSQNINKTKEDLKGIPNTEFAVLDVSRSLEEQNFEGRHFDLIIAADVINTGNNIQASLENLHQLLSPTGRLILREPRPGLLWVKFILGTLPGWWSHAEDLGRTDEPFISAGKWRDALSAAGFADIDHVKPASEQWTSSVVIARPQAPKTPSKRITLLLSNDKASEPSLIVSELQNRGYEMDRHSLGEILPPGQDILALLEEDEPFFENIDESRLTQFKSLLSSLESGSGLLWVTRLSNVGCTDPRYAQVIGLARTLRSEMAVALAILETDKVVSPDGASALARVLSKFQTREDDGGLYPDLEYAIYNGQTLVNRIFPFSLEQELLVVDKSDEAVLSQTHLGRLNTLSWSTTSAISPEHDEIEVELHATGLNFRDVLVGMQIIPGQDPKFGYEASGIVRRIGPKATRLAVGDRVVSMGINALSTTMTSREIYHEKLPDHVSFVEGACIPLIFVTAVYGLRDVGRLSEGQSVLIHSGAGGVGLAAIQVARMLGAEIYTTVGSEKKAQYLVDTYGLPRNHIFNSRNASFVDDVLRETAGKGVDVALNSLAGELLHATWKCIAKWGTMVEIGKRDLLGNARLDMNPFLANRNYCCFDIDQMRAERPDLLNKLLRFTMDSFAQGHFNPIRVDQVFEAPAVLDAFRYMQSGKHIGKIVVQVRDVAGKLLIKDVDATKTTNARLDGAGAYLLIGGLGGLGRSMSVWMAQQGARNFTFLSRSAGSGPHDADFVSELESMGCTVQLVRGDVTNPDDVVRAVDGTIAPLKGVVQMSMVLRDQMFDGMNIEDWSAVTRPKVQGTWNLHNATTASGCELDFFLLFSSLSGVVGQVGQANYASANTFLDAFVQYRTSKNLPCTAIDLGAMEGIGFLANNQELLKKMQGTGWTAVSESELLAALPLAMMSPSTRSQRSQQKEDTTAAGSTFLLGVKMAVPLGSQDSSARAKRDPRIAVYQNMGNGGGTKASSSAPDALRTFLSTVKKDPSLLRSTETVKFLALEVGKKLCSLVLADDSDLEMTANAADFGLDSLVAVEMRAWWKVTFGLDISTLDMVSLGTLEAMGKRITDGLVALYDP